MATWSSGYLKRIANENRKHGKTLLILTGLVVVGILARLAPHLPNATPLNTITNIARSSVGSFAAYGVPIVILLVSDLVIGFYDWRILLSVYGAFTFSAFLARFAPLSSSWSSVIRYPLMTSLSFFIITNGAVWAFSPWYEKSFLGLLEAYEMGLPFLRFMLVGDVLYMATATALFARFPTGRIARLLSGLTARGFARQQ